MAFDFPSSPTTGQTYSVTGGPTYVYNGTAWQVLTPGNQFNRTVFTATAGQTTFTMNYVVGAIDVYRNGVKLAPADFTATSGTSIVLANGCTVGDTVEVISYPMITYSDAVKRTGDTMTGALAVPSLTVNSTPVLAGPAFSAYASTATNIANATWTKLVYATEEFDTNSCYDTATSRFTPNVPGIYVISLNHWINGSNLGAYLQFALYKNGSVINYSSVSTAVGTYMNSLCAVVYANGTTDYFEAYGLHSANSTLNSGTGVAFNFNGSMVRAA